MRTSFMFALLLGVRVAGAEDAALRMPIGEASRRDRQLEVVVDAVRDAASDALLTPRELAARLDGVRLLFVGETHTDIESHRAQLGVIRALHERGRRVLVGLEMFPASAQGVLGRWIDDRELAEPQFLAQAHWYGHWGYNWGYYRDIFQYARANGIRMHGVNVPRAVVQTVRMRGPEALSPEQKALLPERVDAGDAEHRRLFRAFFDAGDTVHGNMPEEMVERMFLAQCTWDAAMGWNAVEALRRDGGKDAIMVVLLGAGHAAYGLGAERQARLWFAGRTASLIPVAVEKSETPTRVQASYADFVWGLPVASEPLYPSLGVSTPEQRAGRPRVIAVTPDSAAAAAGVRSGDELVALDGVPITDKETLNRLVAEKRWGDSVACELLRGTESVVLTLHLRRKTPAGSGQEPPGASAPPMREGR